MIDINVKDFCCFFKKKLHNNPYQEQIFGAPAHFSALSMTNTIDLPIYKVYIYISTHFEIYVKTLSVI